jgi:hypothetical protein
VITDPRRRLQDAAARRAAEVPRLDAAWEDAIRAALTAGVGATEVARLAGCSRERVYQIRDRRR